MDEGEKPNRKIAEKCVIENEEDEATHSFQKRLRRNDGCQSSG
jgi:hypothetical protein